ncbi:hypothetical protein FYZ44_03215 [Mobiluncus mulieris]|nr:hypothetical protein [Mobiluncus mulieris]MCU9995901.1 hypothetical protein [Mobiluncus mulieris]
MPREHGRNLPISSQHLRGSARAGANLGASCTKMSLMKTLRDEAIGLRTQDLGAQPDRDRKL